MREDKSMDSSLVDLENQLNHGIQPVLPTLEFREKLKRHLSQPRQDRVFIEATRNPLIPSLFALLLMGYLVGILVYMFYRKD